ncbi:MAG: glycosyl hydrolase [Desulfitobacteriaceae bacterium]|nr:glycosyl hydrolase [Desulfitobacteriaceae bacterium]
MFHSRVIGLIVLFALIIGAGWWNWEVPQGLPLPSAPEITTTKRWNQDLSGTWDKFSSVRQAWLVEEQRLKGEQPKFVLKGGGQFELPSTQRFSVAAKRFRIPAEWSARTMQLVTSGVKGQVVVYLNGADPLHKIGEFEGSGAQDMIEIPATAFRYGEDNIILLELTASEAQSKSLFSLSWPNDGQITGQIRLQAVIGTVLTNPLLEVSWEDEQAVLTVTTQLVHYNLAEKSSWTVEGVLSDGSAEVARDSLVVEADGTSSQTAVLKFAIGNGHYWSSQDPFLYQLHLRAANSRGDQDDLALPVGLRSIALVEGSWHLNQKALEEVKGQVLSAQKEAQVRNTGEVESYIKSQQEKGVNLLYFLGVFPDELWLQAADRLGMGIWAEWPVGMVPAYRLPPAGEFRELVSAGSRHPSIWAWTVGKGLENSPKTAAFIKEAEGLLTSALAFDLKLTDFKGQALNGTWGQIINEENPESSSWPQESLASQVWLLIIIWISWMNLRTVGWRYKELMEHRPKRRLRQALLWQSRAFMARAGTLAGIITAAVYHLPKEWELWLLHLWPGLELIRYQSPWLIWAVLSLLLILFRVLQAGLVSARLPGSPHPLGLIYWLERRYRWVIIVALLWALVPFGLPIYLPLETYFVLNLLFLPLRVRDVHRIGGHYRLLLVLPGVLGIGLTFWLITRWADLFYLWHNFI